MTEINGAGWREMITLTQSQMPWDPRRLGAIRVWTSLTALSAPSSQLSPAFVFVCLFGDHMGFLLAALRGPPWDARVGTQLSALPTIPLLPQTLRGIN